MRLIRWGFILVLLASVGYFAVFRIKDPERRTLDDRARAGAPGRFVRLADGLTHYEASGPDTGRVVVLAAAFSVPAFIWDSAYQSLADSGFRVIRYDYYGRGWSDRPDVAYDRDLFERQLAGLLDSLGVRQPVALAGVSFGAAIVTNFTDRYPERVGALLYVDPVFNTGRPLPWNERTAHRWGVHMVIHGGTDSMAEGQTYDFFHPERHPDWVTRYRVQQQYRGTREALRRTRVAVAAEPHQGPMLRRLGAHPRPVLVVWGRQDPVAPISGGAGILAVMPQATLVPVDSAGHLPHLERPDVVVPAMVRFLRERWPTDRAPGSPRASGRASPRGPPSRTRRVPRSRAARWR